MCSKEIGYFLRERLDCFIDLDPMSLSMPCRPTNGDCLPIHWSTIGKFIGTNVTRLSSGTAFQVAHNRFGHEKVTNEVIDRISADTDMESSLLISAVIDQSIHLDGLYILMHRDPTAALLRLQQQLEVRKGRNDNTTTDNNNKNNNGGGKNSNIEATNSTITSSTNSNDDDTQSASDNKKRNTRDGRIGIN